MSVFPSDLDVYRVRQSRSHPLRWVRKAWYGRTWQAEWPGCGWCPRGYTEAGVRRKARRWMDRTPEQQQANVQRRRWFRRHITRRAEYREVAE